MVDEALNAMSARFDAMYSKTGRPSIPPEKLLRAQLIQMLYSVRSERLLMEEIDYSMLFRWFVGMNLDEPVWDVTVFTKNRNRLLEGDVAREFLCEVIAQAQAKSMTSDEHFTVDGTLIEAWASLKQIAQIAASIQEFGFTNPILVDERAGIIAGHGRLLAARKPQLAGVPVIPITHLTPAQKRAYIIWLCHGPDRFQ